MSALRVSFGLFLVHLLVFGKSSHFNLITTKIQSGKSANENEIVTTAKNGCRFVIALDS